MLLAHFSDPHLTEPVPDRVTELFNQRLLGYLSWQLQRRRRHSLAQLQELVDDALSQGTEHVLVTGDLTQVGLPSEHRQGRQWLEGLGSSDRVTVLPGNHDAYVSSRWEEGMGLWAPYLPAAGPGRGASPDEVFPIYRELGGVALIGLSTACPSLPFLAMGRIGEEQSARLEGLLRAAGERGLFRIVALHHPPIPGVVRSRKALSDRKAVAEVLGRAGAELLLFGHSHRAGQYRLPTGVGSIPALAVPSASAVSSCPERCGAYNLIRIEGEPGQWEEVLISSRCAGELRRLPSWVALPARDR